MKKLLLPALLMLSVNLIAISNQGISISEDQKSEINDPLLETGIYILCCENGALNLYNLLGNLVGSGTDCGGLVGCYKCILVSEARELEDNPDDPSTAYMLSMLNSLRADTGEPHQGSYGTMPTYYFLASDVTW